MNTTLLSKLETIRVSHGLDRKEFIRVLSTITDKSERTVRRWLSGSQPKRDDLDLIAKYFSVDTHFFRSGATDLIDRILNSDSFGAVLITDGKVSNINTAFMRMMGIDNGWQDAACEIISDRQHKDFKGFCDYSQAFANQYGVHAALIPMTVGGGVKTYMNVFTLSIGAKTYLRVFTEGQAGFNLSSFVNILPDKR